MPSIAIFHSSYSSENIIRDTIAQETGFSIVKEEALIEEAARRFSIDAEKIHRAIYQKASVFNVFTHEKERCICALKSVIADQLSQPQKIYFGYLSSLIPTNVNHVLKILLIDNKEARLARATKNELTHKEAKKSIKDSDFSAFDWTDYLHGRQPWDASLYDMVIPVGEKTAEEIARLVSEQCAQGPVLEQPASKKSVADLALASKIEMMLLLKGHVTDIEIYGDSVIIKVNKSVINFDGLKTKLKEMVDPIAHPYEVEVRKGKNYALSVYRDQEFKLPPKVLLVDDEKDFALTLSERLISRNVGSYAVFDGQQALEFLGDENPDVIVLDLKMPGIDGLEVLDMVKRNNPNIEIIILTGHGTEDDKKRCMEMGAFAYLQKPTDIKTLSATIHEAYLKAMEIKST